MPAEIPTTKKPIIGKRYVPAAGRRTKPRIVGSGTFGDWVWSSVDGNVSVKWSLDKWERWVHDNAAIMESAKMHVDLKTTGPEIRHNEDGTLDEVVASACFFHLEKMDDSQWWMSVTAGGVETHITLYTKRGAKILANVIPNVR